MFGCKMISKRFFITAQPWRFADGQYHSALVQHLFHYLMLKLLLRPNGKAKSHLRILMAFAHFRTLLAVLKLCTGPGDSYHLVIQSIKDRSTVDHILFLLS